MVTIHERKNLATCLGYRYGTGCMHRTRDPQKRVNWEKWQLCHHCARILHPEYYKDKKKHGVKTTQGAEFSKTPFGIVEMPVS